MLAFSMLERPVGRPSLKEPLLEFLYSNADLKLVSDINLLMLKVGLSNFSAPGL